MVETHLLEVLWAYHAEDPLRILRPERLLLVIEREPCVFFLVLDRVIDSEWPATVFVVNLLANTAVNRAL